MGMNISIVKKGKNTKIEKIPGEKYGIIEWKENEYGEYLLEKDELCISTERALSYMIYDNILSEPEYKSNDNWNEKLKFELNEDWKKIKIDKDSVWVFSKHSKEMQVIIDELSSAKNFYDFASVIKKYDLELGGF